MPLVGERRASVGGSTGIEIQIGQTGLAIRQPIVLVIELWPEGGVKRDAVAEQTGTQGYGLRFAVPPAIENEHEHDNEHDSRGTVCGYLAGTVHCDEKYLRDELRPIIPYPTGRFLRGGCPRHFVPGYDRVVPLGQHGSRSRYFAWHETPTLPMRPSIFWPLRSLIVLVVVLVIELWPLLGKRGAVAEQT